MLSFQELFESYLSGALEGVDDTNRTNVSSKVDDPFLRGYLAAITNVKHYVESIGDAKRTIG